MTPKTLLVVKRAIFALGSNAYFFTRYVYFLLQMMYIREARSQLQARGQYLIKTEPESEDKLDRGENHHDYCIYYILFILIVNLNHSSMRECYKFLTRKGMESTIKLQRIKIIHIWVYFCIV